MDVPNPWFTWDYLERNGADVAEHLSIHATLTAQAMGIALAIALPLAIVGHFYPRAAKPILGVSAVMYTIPSLALFALLAPLTGIGRTTVLIGLVAYAMLALVKNILTGLQGVDRDVVDAARGIGFSRLRLLFSVEIPNALPAIFSGLRVATVTTVALVTVGIVVGYGGLGQLMFRGFTRNYRAEIATNGLLIVLLALAADLLLLALAWALTPWARKRSS